MARDPFSCKYSLKFNHLNICEYIPLIAFAGSGTIWQQRGNHYQLLKTSRVIATGTTVATATDTATATGSETATATAT
jgi:hypothetical protein